MGFWGKAIGAGFGFMIGGPIGAIFLGALGHLYDKGMESLAGSNTVRCPFCGIDISLDDFRSGVCPACKHRLSVDEARTNNDRQFVFYVSLASLAAKMAKADGVVTSDEVKAFDNFVRFNLNLDINERKIVAQLFNEAKASPVNAAQIAGQFKNIIGFQPDVMQILIQLLFQISMADGRFHPAEERFIKDVAGVFGLSRVEYDQIKAMFVKGNGSAYQVLGVSQNASDDEIKSVYRKLVMQYHPDKLMAKGMPEDFIRNANQKMAEINSAYDAISKERGIN
ncbi:MAG: TerB family tellurite resistance protein [Calditrichaceae bacterium]|nr:TerB family tellurite resistance protein [Calditrichaceae bacterium]